MEAGLWDLDSIDTRPDAQHYLAEDRREKLALAFRKNCETKTLPTLSLYEQRLERSFYKSLRELRQLQADRRSTTSETEVGPALSPVDTPLGSSTGFESTTIPDTEPRPRESGQNSFSPQSHIPQIGFVCSNPENEDEAAPFSQPKTSGYPTNAPYPEHRAPPARRPLKIN